MTLNGRRRVDADTAVYMFVLAARDGACEPREVCIAASSWSEASRLVRGAGFKKLPHRPKDGGVPEDVVHVALTRRGEVLEREWGSNEKWRPATGS